MRTKEDSSVFIFINVWYEELVLSIRTHATSRSTSTTDGLVFF